MYKMSTVLAQSRKRADANQLRLQSVFVCVPLLVLVACSPRAIKPSNHQPAAPVSSSVKAGNTSAGTDKTFTSVRYGVRINYPAELELRQTFKRNYLGNGGWKTYMGPDSPPGKPLVALVLPGSNPIAAGELRIGVSRQPNAVRTCTDLPAAALPDTQGQTTISGVTFATFKARDAAMNHYLVTQSYRAVHSATCYAMDVLVFGTNPEVYDPPTMLPFAKAQVFARLVRVARNLQFIPEPHRAVAALPISPPVTYKGLLPCADCPGIAYQLNLLPNYRYHLRLDYQDRNAQFDQQGRWRLSNNGKLLILHEKNKNSSIQKWAVLDDGQQLRLLDRTGRPVRSGLNYDLTRSAQFEPLVAGKKKSQESASQEED